MAKNFTYPRCPGKTFYQIFREAKVTAKTLGVSVDVTFNGTELTIHEDSALADSQEILLLKEVAAVIAKLNITNMKDAMAYFKTHYAGRFNAADVKSCL